ncbi:hypothetical protein TNCT_11921 [Trichonephila clavata]|uniref:Uncharacterized protein n=1 Tax=Trichonephila clavata TaxID=2740835 RepID=A0A8X6F7H0_TRICU|nr:hypothetical protein TNCT_11921 [Trichonephila clavata]
MLLDISEDLEQLYYIIEVVEVLPLLQYVPRALCCPSLYNCTTDSDSFIDSMFIGYGLSLSIFGITLVGNYLVIFIGHRVRLHLRQHLECCNSAWQ